MTKERVRTVPKKGASKTPSSDEPLRGLQHLSKVALLGRSRILSMADLPVQYVWRDIAVSGTIVLLAGGPGEGKTTLLFLILAARMNVGEPVSVLGRVVEPAPPGMWIVLVEGEHGETSTSRKLRASCRLLGLDEAALDRIVVIARRAVRIGSPEWGDVQKMVAAGIVSDIAVDTIARCAPADANDEAAQVAIFDAISQTIDAAPSHATKPLCWGAAHTRKGGNGGLEDVSGSAQRTGQADTVLLIRGEKSGGRTVSSTVTFAKLREDPDEYPQPVEFAIVADELGRRRLRLADEAPLEDEGPLEARILALLEMGPKTKSRIAETLKRSRACVDDAISTLFADRRITTVAATNRGRTFRAFALRTNPDSNPDKHSSNGTRTPNPDETRTLFGGLS